MNERNQAGKMYASPQRQGTANIYAVPHDFDKTTTTLLPLDYYLVDKDVYSLVQTLFSDTIDWSQWAIQNPYDASCYFSPPFSCRQAFLLGYGSEEKTDKNEKKIL